MNDPTSLLNFIPEGVSVTAVLVTVFVFLKHNKTYADRLSDIGKDCHTHATQMMDQYQASLQLVVQMAKDRDDQFADRLKSLEESISKLADKVSEIGTRA